MDPKMDPTTKKNLMKAVTTVMTLCGDDHLDEAGRDAMAEATELLALYAGRTVVSAFIEWQRNGSIRRDPRPRPLYTTADKPPARPKHERLF